MNPFQTLRHCEIFALRMAAATGRPFHVLRTYGPIRERCVIDHDALVGIHRRGVIAMIELTIEPPQFDEEHEPVDACRQGD